MFTSKAAGNYSHVLKWRPQPAMLPHSSSTEWCLLSLCSMAKFSVLIKSSIFHSVATRYCGLTEVTFSASNVSLCVQTSTLKALQSSALCVVNKNVDTITHRGSESYSGTLFQVCIILKWRRWFISTHGNTYKHESYLRWASEKLFQLACYPKSQPVEGVRSQLSVVSIDSFPEHRLQHPAAPCCFCPPVP